VQEEKVIKPRGEFSPNLKQEPLDTDYIPVSKTSKRVFKPTVHEQDLKEVFSKISKKFEPAKNTIVKASSASFQVVKNTSERWLVVLRILV
jgi:chromosome condensin MukBEF complex kleisin-like MukF subunit